MQLALQAQYDNISKNFGLSARYRWEYQPGNEIFVALASGDAPEQPIRRADLATDDSASAIRFDSSSRIPQAGARLPFRHRRARIDVLPHMNKRFPLLAAETQIGARLRQMDLPDQIAVRRIARTPNSLGHRSPA
jgi:hypothetical protein